MSEPKLGLDAGSYPPCKGFPLQSHQNIMSLSAFVEIFLGERSGNAWFSMFLS